MPDRLEGLLLAWGAWVDAGGRTGDFPRTNPMHPQWTPPSTLHDHLPRRGGRDYADLHRQIAALSPKLRDALVLHYVKRCPVRLHALQAGCAESTISARLASARRALSGAVP